MPATDPTFIIGVIRAKEKSFLEADEYVRLMDAPHISDCLRTLIDTPYGRWLESADKGEKVLEALGRHVLEEYRWLSGYIDNRNVQFFMTARYDALNIASALLKWKNGDKAFVRPSAVASISQDALYTAIWGTAANGTASLGVWQSVILQEKREVKKPDWKYSAMLQRMGNHMLAVMRTLAFTPLMREITQLQAHKTEIDTRIRPAAGLAVDPAHLLQQVVTWGYKEFTLPALAAVVNATDATAYELAWDSELIHLLRARRLGVSGYDPIISYFLGKQMESRNLRQILSAKLAGLPQETVVALKRPYYQYTYV